MWIPLLLMGVETIQILKMKNSLFMQEYGQQIEEILTQLCREETFASKEDTYKSHNEFTFCAVLKIA